MNNANKCTKYVNLGISGGFEAGLQLTLTVWLVLKKVISVEHLLNVRWSKGSYGNFFPSIPFISALSSFLTMISACIRFDGWKYNIHTVAITFFCRMNIPLPYQAYPLKDFSKRYERQVSHMLGSLPHFVLSSLFRVFSFAFMWIYLAFYATVPILVLLFINILIFYILESDKGKIY